MRRRWRGYVPVMDPEPGDGLPSVCVFAPSPLLTTTIQDGPDGPDVHVHPGASDAMTAGRLTERIVVAPAKTAPGESR